MPFPSTSLQAAARLSLALLALGITLPFLLPEHYLPLATFRQEWLAMFCGLFALLPLALQRDGEWTVPRTALLPLGLAALVWTQWLAGIDVRFETSLIASLYFVWAFLVMLVTRRISDALGRESVATLLASALLIGALLLAASGALQRWAPGLGLPWVFPITAGSISGNVAQPNNFADYLWIGIVAGLWLAFRQRLHPAAMLAGVLPLLVLSLLSGSRSVYLYAVATTLWLAGWSLCAEPVMRRRLRVAACTILPLVALAQWLIGMTGDTVSTAQRIVAQTSYDSVRANLWLAALDIFREHPLLGAGFDSYSREFFARVDRFPINGAGVPEHSHNLLTEFAAEFGAIGLALLLATTALWIGGLRRSLDATNMLVLAILAILGIHSLLEYPLWYAHFLAIAAIMVCLADPAGAQVGNAVRHRVALAGVSLCGFIVLASFGHDYLRLEHAANGIDAERRPIPAQLQHDIIAEAYARSIWRPYAALQFASRMPIGAGETGARLAMTTEALHFSPIRQGVFRHAALLQLAGETEAASRQLKLAALAYPGEVKNAAEMLRLAAAENPALLALVAQLDQRSF